MSAKNFTYTLQIDAEIKNLLAKTEQIKKNMAGIMANGKMPEMEKQFLAIERSLTKLQEKAATPITSAAAFGSMQKDVAATKVAIEGLSGSVTKLQTASTGEKLQFIDPNMLKTIQAADAALDAFGTATSEASKKTTDLITAEKLLAAANRDVEKAQNGVNKSQEKADAAKGRADAAKQEAEAIKKKLEVLQKWQATQKAYDTADASGKKPDKRSAISPDVNYRKDKNAAEGLGIDISTPEKLNAAIQTLTTSLTAQESEVSRLNGQYTAAEKSLKNHKDKLVDATNASNSAQTAFDRLNSEFEQNKAKNSQVAFDTLRASVEKLGIDLSDIPTQYTEQNLEALRAKCDQLKNQGIQNIDTSLDGLETSLRETGEAAEATSNKISESTGEFKKLDDQAGQTQAFANRIKQFVGIQGAAMVARRALRDAFNAIKELDAAMTEMAVVTDTDISGYWDQLPEYTERANKLGLTIKDVYQADTLFYQQGLKTNEVIELSTQTMKMARVAGLDTAEATDRMTAALRGFNMELNETNAQKIADVYSELAAITASDVDEISSAMTKTASIAANAGMEFETTAAFLSQIIETTRESAETAGTAMKTVIARFQELKKDPADIGEVDGEIVDANKIETALRSVGVSLRDTNGQFRELDDVFLELSSKWDSLDTNTQRYIATIAAGSRQQSRFIAMMSDYNRTAELVEAANTSAGASNEQFEKTMDSLDAKLNELKNAWNSFTMSIMDSDLLKAGVEILTNILTAINNITNSLGEFSGAAKIGIVIAALYLGDKALKVFLGSLSETKSVFAALGTVGRSAMTGMASGVTGLSKGLAASNLQAQKLSASLKMATGTKLTKNITAYRQALNQQTVASKAAQTQENAYNVALYSSRTTTEQLNRARLASVAADKAKVAADAGVIASEKAIAASLGLTTAQEVEANAIKALGVSYDQAAIMASAGYTAAEISEAAATQNLSATEVVEGEIKKQNTKATGLAAVASFILASAHTLQTQGLKGLIKSWWAQLTAKFADIGATWGQVGANVALQASMWPVLVVTLLIIAAIAVLVLAIWGVVEAIKHFQSQTPEAKLAAAEEAAEKAAEGAREAKEAYEELQESFDKYKEISSSLEELEDGTLAWREAMLEVNQIVLELLSLYPQLASYVQMLDNGMMEISPEGMEVVSSIALQQYQNSATIASMAQVMLVEQKAENARENSDVMQDFDRSLEEDVYVYNAYSESDVEVKREGLKSKIDSGTFDLSSKTYSLDELDQLTKEELAQIYGRQYGYNQEAILKDDSLNYTRENMLKKLKEDKTYEEYTVYSQDLVDLTTNDAGKMDNLIDQQEEYLAYLKESVELEKEKVAIMKNAITTQMDSKIAAAGYSQMITEALGSVDLNLTEWKKTIADSNEAKDKNNGLWTNSTNDTNKALKEKLQERGLVATGDEKKDMQQYLKALTGQEYDYSQDGKAADNNMAELIAQAEMAEKYGAYVDHLYEAGQSDYYIDQALKGNLDVSLESAKDAMDAYEASVGTGIAWANDTVLNQSFDKVIEKIEEKKAAIDKRMTKIFGEGFEFSSKKGAYATAQEFLSAYDLMLSYAGEGVATLFAGTMQRLNKDLENKKINDQQFSTIMTNFTDVNWGSAIEGAAALKEMYHSGEAYLQEFAESVWIIEQAAYSTSAQMDEFFHSLDSDSLKELAKDGKISGTEMLELAKTNEKLATMLDNTSVSAAALGHYYELLEEGAISTFEATENFVQALGELNAAENTIEDSFAFLDTFEPSRSSTEIGKYFGEMRTSLKELYDMGAYGDQQLQDYIVALLGEDNWQEILSSNDNNLKKAIDSAMSQIDTYGENLYGVWQELANAGMEGISFDDTGKLLFDLTAIGSVDELKQRIMDMGWSEAMADALVADAQTFSSDLAAGLKDVGIEQALTTWLSEQLVMGDERIITKSQVEIMAKKLGMEFQELANILDQQGTTVMDVLTEEGVLSTDMRQKIIDDAKEAGKFDLDTNYQLLLELGLDDIAAKETLKSLAGSLTDVPLSLNNETVEHTGNIITNTTGVATEGGTVSGLIDGLENPKAKAAQELSALQQGEMMAQAHATGSIVASRLALQTTAQGIDTLINGAIDILNKIPGVNIGKSNLAGSVASGTKQLVQGANATIASYNADKITALQGIINGTTESVDSSAAVGAIMDAYGSKGGTTASAYENYSSQAKGSWQKPEGDNAYSTVYKLDRKAQQITRSREKYEQMYLNMLEEESKTLAEVNEYKQAYLETFQLENAQLRSQIAEHKNAMQNNYDSLAANEKSIFSKYGFIFNSSGSLAQMGDYSEASEEEKNLIESYLETYFDLEDSINEATDTIADNNQAIRDYYKTAKTNTGDFYDQIKEALVDQRQKEIDELININDSIVEAQDALLDSMQKQIEEQRQARENEQAVQDITDAEARLAFLRQDTGANRVEIMELEKTIAEQKQDYQDSLIDQTLERLEESNEQAAEQRQKQIDLATAQLQLYQDSTAIWEEVRELVNGALNSSDPESSPLGQLLASAAGVAVMNQFASESWWEAFKTSLADANIAMRYELTNDGNGNMVITPKAYKMGGLADYTGPAWLDGTKSRPELVLNQKDTSNFIALKDILSEIMTRSDLGTTTAASGDNYFDIEINVDSLNSDYDVEQIANKIRDMLYKDATYRNVNTVNQKK